MRKSKRQTSLVVLIMVGMCAIASVCMTVDNKISQEENNTECNEDYINDNHIIAVNASNVNDIGIQNQVTDLDGYLRIMENYKETNDSLYSDDSKNYIIVSEYNSMQLLDAENVKIQYVDIDHSLKNIKVYITADFYGVVADSSYYIVAIPTNECDESYTVEIVKVDGNNSNLPSSNLAGKPVIYLYPEKETDVKVQLDFNGELITTYPDYKDGWEVTAYIDGTLIDKQGREYNYLFWEGITEAEWDFSKGFCIKGKDTIEFLEESLTKLGLTDKEQADFITYWAPKMQNNEYNLIAFQTEVYEDQAKLTVTGEDEVDTEIRVFMAWKGLDTKVEIKEQELISTDRKGFTLVEWGGCEVTN